MALELNKVYNIDSRNLDKVIKRPIIDITITSPPYFDLKDYGHKDQIGFGQSYETYLNDLKDVFSKVYKATKENGTLWVVIDTYRKDGEMFTLPFDFAIKLKGIGWKLQEIIIWQKDKTVPWAHKGQMRNIFEYILFFSKSKNYKFNVDKIRQNDTLRKWWVKYPERYNPKGKTPDGIWNFQIPTQGSWGNGYISHFCPLPDGLIKQILKIGSDKNAIVLDPFSGSGSVLCSAYALHRKYIGFELNNEYIKMFKKYLNKKGASIRKAAIDNEKKNLAIKDFEGLIIKLRVLKFARLIFRKLPPNAKYEIKKIIAGTYKSIEQKGDKILAVKYILIVKKPVNELFKAKLNALLQKPPLSKFGIIPQFQFTTVENILKNKNYIKKKYYTYTITNTHHFVKHITFKDLNSFDNNEVVISSIKVELTESDHE